MAMKNAKGTIDDQYPAAADLKKGTWVSVSSNALVQHIDPTAKPHGVLGEDVLTGQLGQVIIAGPAEVRVNAVLTPGQGLMPTTGGRSTPHTGTGTNFDMGRALNAGPAPSGDNFGFAEVLLYDRPIIV